MTATQQRPDRPPVRARSGRRPIPPLIFLLVLALGALGVWWNVLRQDNERQASQAATCTSAAEAVPSLDPATLSIRVLNDTDRAGAAGIVAAQLRERGFVVDEVGNDASDREVTGVGEFRYGPRGAEAARFVRLLLPGAGDLLDTRATSQIDLVIGPELEITENRAALATVEEVEAAIAAAASASEAAC